eukprot:scaffold18_cov401-Prasinococcus_capsulatus_cf.AAC.11
MNPAGTPAASAAPLDARGARPRLAASVRRETATLDAVGSVADARKVALVLVADGRLILVAREGWDATREPTSALLRTEERLRVADAIVAFRWRGTACFIAESLRSGNAEPSPCALPTIDAPRRPHRITDKRDGRGCIGMKTSLSPQIP